MKLFVRRWPRFLTLHDTYWFDVDVPAGRSLFPESSALGEVPHPVTLFLIH
jgi:hypothetical protein